MKKVVKRYTCKIVFLAILHVLSNHAIVPIYNWTKLSRERILSRLYVVAGAMEGLHFRTRCRACARETRKQRRRNDAREEESWNMQGLDKN